MKIVINNCYGGFSLSEEGVRRYAEIKGITLWPEADTKYKSLGVVHFWTVPPEQRPKMIEHWHQASLEERQANNEAFARAQLYDREIPRDDPALVQVVQELGKAANGHHAALKVVTIPDGVQWEIDEYDGLEAVHEKHRSWS